jgi:hypothetical protein
MAEMRNAYRNLDRIIRGKDRFGDLGVNTRIILKRIL